MRGKKAKKKSKSKKSSKDREWTHEGGTTLAANPNSSHGSERPKYRVTQENDEKNRRVRFKQELLRQKKSFVRKMSQKLSFRDVLQSASPLEFPSAPSDKAEEKSPHSRPSPASKLDIAQRLKMMVSRVSSDNDVVRAETESEHDSEELEMEDSAMDGPDADNVTAEDFTSKDMTTEGGVSDFAVDEEESCSEDEEESRTTGDGYKQFFAYDWNKIPVDRPKHALLTTAEGLEFHGSLNPEMALPPRMRQLRDIPGLSKLWRSRRNESLSPLSASLLPYLASYSDLLFEAVTTENEEEVLRTMTLHCLVHVLRARWRILCYSSALNDDV